MKKSKLILSLYIGAIALSVATLSMSLAWYANSTKLRINSINISIDCDRQLAISTAPDGKYVTSLDKQDLEDCGSFYPVTSAHSEWYDVDKKDMPDFYFDTNYTEEEYAQLSSLASLGYFAQKLYLKSDDDVLVSINPKETFINPNTEFNKTYAHELFLRDPYISEAEYEFRLNELVKSMRYLILINDMETDNYKYIIIDPNKNSTTTYGGLLDNNDDDYYDYFKKESDGKLYERVYGEVNDRSLIIYDDPLEEDSDYKDVTEEPNAFNARHKKGVYRFNREQSIENGLVFKEEVSHTLDEFEGVSKPFYFPVYVDRPQEIVLSIYIEGWDLDSVNSNMGATFNSNITFKIEREL